MKTNLILLAVASCSVLASCNMNGALNATDTQETKENVEVPASMKNAKDSLSFYFGFSYASNLKQMGFKSSDIDMNALKEGLEYTFNGNTPDMNAANQFMESEIQKIQKRAMDERNAKGEINKVKGEEFLAKTKSEAGIDTLEGGILYKVEKMGEGECPADTSEVKVNYTGRTIDGKEFDSSKGTPVQFPLNRVIKGWTVALQHMPVGSKWTIYIPSELAYGKQGNRAIEPNSVLIFDVELVEIVKPESK